MPKPKRTLRVQKHRCIATILYLPNEDERKLINYNKNQTSPQNKLRISI